MWSGHLQCAGVDALEGSGALRSETPGGSPDSTIDSVVSVKSLTFSESGFPHL